MVDTGGDSITTDVRCIECGYFLRGLAPGGRCPECGTAVQASLVGKDLHLASLTWLHEIRRGFWLMKAALATSLLALAAGMLASLISWVPASWVLSVSTVVAEIILLAAAGIALVGFVLATRAEPLVTATGEGLSARRLSRLLGGSALLLRAALWVIVEAGPKNAVVDVIVIVLPICATALAMTAVLVFARHMRGLLERTPEEKTLKASREVVVLAGATLGFLVVGTVSRGLLPRVQQTAPLVAEKVDNLSKLANSISSCGMPLVVLGLLSLVWQVSNALGRTLSKAEAHARGLEAKQGSVGD